MWHFALFDFTSGENLINPNGFSELHSIVITAKQKKAASQETNSGDEWTRRKGRAEKHDEAEK